MPCAAQGPCSPGSHGRRRGPVPIATGHAAELKRSYAPELDIVGASVLPDLGGHLVPVREGIERAESVRAPR
ncbi:hypothetical protein NN3_12890 [Nocardia neocaledoniensis NBRC 108232]|nr:hypothetical protein NN3_12890 [Nocardia neocaledoniensis NBRC 108232]